MLHNGDLDLTAKVRNEDETLQDQIRAAIGAINEMLSRLPPQLLGPDGALLSPADLPHESGQALLRLSGEVTELRRRINELAAASAA